MLLHGPFARGLFSDRQQPGLQVLWHVNVDRFPQRRFKSIGRFCSLRKLAARLPRCQELGVLAAGLSTQQAPEVRKFHGHCR